MIYCHNRIKLTFNELESMDFPLRTEIEINCPKWEFDYQKPSIFIGSCFSDNIGGMLYKYKFPVLLNPFGVLYNPASIAQALQLIINNQEIKKEELIFHGNLWHSFSFHGSFSNSSPEKVLQKCNDAITSAHTWLKNARFLLITFGTAWIYRYQPSGMIVSNCHKIEAKQFERYRMQVDEIAVEWLNLLALLHSFNPTIKVLFTVSPVRHLKDSAHGNQLSKSTLLLAIDKIIHNYQSGQLSYFPAYELVNDELRDYRFYDSDMIHISETAINFIFEKFKEAFFSKQTSICFEQVKSVIQASEHRILTDNKQELKVFSNSMLTKIEKIKKAFPYINFQEEVEHFQTMAYLDEGFC